MAAVDLGFGVAQMDREGGQLYLNRRRRLSSTPRRFAVSVTDSGLGTTVVHISWYPPPRAPWPLRSDGRRAARLCRLTDRALAAG